MTSDLSGGRLRLPVECQLKQSCRLWGTASCSLHDDEGGRVGVPSGRRSFKLRAARRVRRSPTRLLPAQRRQQAHRRVHLALETGHLQSTIHYSSPSRALSVSPAIMWLGNCKYVRMVTKGVPINSLGTRGESWAAR